MVWGRAKAHQTVRAGVPCVGGERVGRGAFSESSVPEPLSTDMRSCWKAANPGGVSRGAAVAGVRAASAMAANGARESPNRLSAAREGILRTSPLLKLAKELFSQPSSPLFPHFPPLSV